MFAVIKNQAVVGFITEETQKEFLIEHEPEIAFAAIDWQVKEGNQATWLLPSDVVVNTDGTATVMKEIAG
jgi:hypothetical protein